MHHLKITVIGKITDRIIIEIPRYQEDIKIKYRGYYNMLVIIINVYIYIRIKKKRKEDEKENF